MHTDSLPHPATGRGLSSSRGRGLHTRGRSQHDSPAAQLLCTPAPLHASPSRFEPGGADGGVAGGGPFGAGGGSSPSRGGRPGVPGGGLVVEGSVAGDGWVEGCAGAAGAAAFEDEGAAIGPPEAPVELSVVSPPRASAGLVSGPAVGRSVDCPQPRSAKVAMRGVIEQKGRRITRAL